MDLFVRETLSRERMSSLLAEADRDRLARACRAGRSELRAPWHRRLLAPFRGWIAAAAHRAFGAARPARP